MAEQNPKRRGRPPLDPAARKDGNLTFRTRGDLRQRLADEAKKNSRTISEEVEWRLERSLAGISGADSEPAQFYNNIKVMLGDDIDFSEAIELGLYWNRVKNSFFAFGDQRKTWFDDEEALLSVEEDMKGGLRRMLRGFAGRRRREAAS